jgi:hypothetical protein
VPQPFLHDLERAPFLRLVVHQPQSRRRARASDPERAKERAFIGYRIATDQSAGVPVSFLVGLGSVIRSLPGLRMASPGPLLAAAGRGAYALGKPLNFC